MKLTIRTLLWAILLVLSIPAISAEETTPLGGILGDEGDEFEYDSSGDKPWREVATQRIPPLPLDAQLMPVPIDSLPPALTLYLDRQGPVLTSQDRILRFWVVIKSSSGAFNATYEGLRCDTRQFKVYAYGRRHASPSVRPAPKPVWRDIGALPGDHFRRELAGDYLCDGPTPREPDEIVQLIKQPDLINSSNDLSDD